MEVRSIERHSSHFLLFVQIRYYSFFCCQLQISDVESRSETAMKNLA